MIVTTGAVDRSELTFVPRDQGAKAGGTCERRENNITEMKGSTTTQSHLLSRREITLFVAAKQFAFSSRLPILTLTALPLVYDCESR